MTTYNGYTKDLSPEEKLKNEIEAIKSILQNDPNNEYWQNRLTALTCSCFLYQGDNSDCPVHGKGNENKASTESGLYNCQLCGEEKLQLPGYCEDCLTPPSEEEIKSQYYSDYGMDYQERNDLYAMGIGY